ncbi:glutathione S-transferase C-terminal domain-containing protein [Alkalilimnicola ehrlichii]|uniref:glutathione S-transferase C-terminal domain-containing protein n=1 Tax=Alkalilimnicola ehrlichii TaxID=351052 RepID=UPI001C6F1F8A|nr:glutathione S-transferase C-terminal domain-containing protein [Alkalilimnicola ehrlichii]
MRHAFASGTDAATAAKLMTRMQSYLPRLGVTPETAPLIERSYERLLEILETHFTEQPYLLGGRPSTADYGLIGPLFAHLGRDPVPAQIMKLRSPRVYRWVERMTAPGLDTIEYPGTAAEFWPGDGVPPSLEPLLLHVAEEIFPELDDKLAFMDAWVEARQPADAEPVTEKPHHRQLGTINTQFRGASVEVGVEPYLLYLLQRGSDLLDGLDGGERERVMGYLQRFGLKRVLPQGKSYTVGRRDHIEVWRRF